MLMMDDNQKARTWWAIAYSIVERAILTYERAPRVFFLSAVLFYLPTLAYGFLDPHLHLNAWLTTLLGFIFSMATFVLSAAASTRAVAILEEGRRPTLGEALGAVTSAAAPLAATVLICGVLEAAAICALVVPGIVTLFWIAFAGPAASEERLTGWAAVQRGRFLVGDARWMQVAAVLAIGFGVHFCLGMVPSLGAHVYLMLSHQETPLLTWAIRLWGWLMDTALISFFAAWVGVAYFDILRMLDAERAARKLAATSSAKAREAAESSRPSGRPSR
jgi:hypothetical protein